jgi:hypothetical protein
VKIVSGAQTGVDRAALDAALEMGVKTGGWCPEGRIAEDGLIPERYLVKVLPKAGYRQRTKKNVVDSDGTAIIYFEYPSGGTEQTILFCIKERSPYALIDGHELTTEQATRKIIRFIEKNNILTLNVAGPRESGEARGYEYAKNTILGTLQNYS